jgi:hypothetical protein
MAANGKVFVFGGTDLFVTPGTTAKLKNKS